MLLTPTEDEITKYLDDIKKLIDKNEKNLIISTNRKINLEFMIKYGLNSKMIIKIIKNLKRENFREKLINEHTLYKNEYLYVFSIDLQLNNIDGSSKLITVYIKFNLLPNKVILVSFHEAKYKFKEKR